MYKKKKSHKLGIVLLIVCIFAVAAAIWQWNAGQTTEEEETLVLLDNQQLRQVSVHSMMGNEMTGYLIENDTVTDEEQTWLIPVGTDVVTKLGTTTSFARLASGDQIEMLVETVADGSEEILKIWIVQ